MSRDDKLLMLFESIHKVMLAERLIVKINKPYQIIPVPKQYSSECGMCIEIISSDKGDIVAELQRNEINFNIVKRGL